MKKLLLLTGLIFNAAWCLAQDTLVKTNAEEIQVKILEITPDLIKYKRFDNLEGPEISVQKQDVAEIKYANGLVEKFDITPKPVNSETPKPLTIRKSALALNVLPVLAQSFNVFYDQRLAGKPNIALSLGFGVYIHPDDFFSPVNNQISLTGAAKFYIQESSFYLSPYVKYRNVSYTQYTYQNPYQQSTSKINWNQFGGGATFGARHVFKSGFLIDSFMGLGGYAIEQSNNRTGEEIYFSPSDLDIRLGVALGFAF